MLLIAFSKPPPQPHLVDEETVAGALFVPLYDFVMQRVVLEQRLVVEVQQIDVDVVGGWVPPSNGAENAFMSSDLPERRIPAATLMSWTPSSAQSRSMYVLRSTQSIISSFSVSKPRRQYAQGHVGGVNPSHVMSAEALDRRHDEVEIALDLSRALFRHLDGICDAVEHRQRVLLRAAFGIGIALAPHGNVTHRRNDQDARLVRRFARDVVAHRRR